VQSYAAGILGLGIALAWLNAFVPLALLRGVVPWGPSYGSSDWLEMGHAINMGKWENQGFFELKNPRSSNLIFCYQWENNGKSRVDSI
jgi:hypothetical protein